MKSNKQRLYEFMADYNESLSDEDMTFTTSFLSEKMNMQRTNVSALLNQLCEEGKVVKSKGRPVLYHLDIHAKHAMGNREFDGIIGYDRSLGDVIKVLKAAIMYPSLTKKILLIGHRGSGIDQLAREAFSFACSQGFLHKEDPYQIIDCAYYRDDQLEEKMNAFHKEEQQGFLLIKNAQFLSGAFISLLVEKLNHPSKKAYLCIVHMEKDEKLSPLLKDDFHFHATMPLLSQRSLQERFDLIEDALQNESSRLDRKIMINHGLMQCLMLFPCHNDLEDLYASLRFGIANANARMREGVIILEIADLQPEVRKGLLFVKSRGLEVNEVIGEHTSFIFAKNQTLHSHETQGHDFHEETAIDPSRMLFDEHDLGEAMGEYMNNLTQGYDEEKLKKVVAPVLIEKVSLFMKKASQNFDKNYSEKIFFAIALQLEQALKKKTVKRRFTNDQILDIIEDHPEVYAFSKQFILELEDVFSAHFSRDEALFLTLFLISQEHKMSSRVVTLLALHGEGSATSLVHTCKELLGGGLIEAFDLMLDEPADASYDALKEKIIAINQGKGVFVIYDMGSIKVMLDSIQEETHISISALEVPITLLSMSAMRLSDQGYSLEEINAHVCEEQGRMTYARKEGQMLIALSRIKEDQSQAILNRCLSIEGIENIRIIPLQCDDGSQLLSMINELKGNDKILGIVGTYNPEIFNIPFLDEQDLDEKRSVDDLFEDKEDFDVFDYLCEQFHTFQHKDLEVTLLPFLSKLEDLLGKKLDEDHRIGLLVHIACLIDGLMRNQSPTVNFNASSIIAHHQELVNQVSELLEPVEAYFHIRINQPETAVIVNIVL